MKTDEQLVDAAQHGSNAAFDELVLRYREKLFRFLLTRCACYADAEDVIQDTFVNAYRYLSSYDSRWRFSTWLYRIAIRNAMRQPASGRQAGDASAENLTTGQVNEKGPLENCIAGSDRENLWLSAREILSPDAYIAMWLHYVEDMPVKEVSRALDRSLSWTKVTMLRSRRKLTQRLATEAATDARSRNYG